ncbi:hypothetical protein [Gordonia sp. NB41Y]|uniref:hypothetical protein n=1 Tax=Gordonia sp. NB41Y TaxID=875808 RepID=UPI0002BF4C7B|nr:hypothetical protein [Gordonia sp. NB41Y]WLP89942.1 hypothetical protein Q9K23_20775 [Gordonia sp. NB41Y]
MSWRSCWSWVKRLPGIVWAAGVRWFRLGLMYLRRWWAVPAALLVAAVVGWVLWRVCTDDRADLGTVPAWVSATGTVATLVGVVVAVSTYRRQRRSEVEDQACQVRLLRVSHPPGPKHEGKFTRWVDIENRSDESIYDLRVEAFRAEVEPGKGGVWMRPIDFVRIGEQVLAAGALAWTSRIGPGEKWELQWAADEDQKRHRRRTVVGLQYTVTDSNGRVWLVSDNYEPEKITRRSRSRNRRLRL